MKLTPKLEALVDDLIEKVAGPCSIAIKDSGVEVSDLDEVIVLGGRTRSPRFSRR